jgi:hypothetical protein
VITAVNGSLTRGSGGDKLPYGSTSGSSRHRRPPPQVAPSRWRRLPPVAAPNVPIAIASGAVDGGTLFNLGDQPAIPRLRRSWRQPDGLRLPHRRLQRRLYSRQHLRQRVPSPTTSSACAPSMDTPRRRRAASTAGSNHTRRMPTRRRWPACGRERRRYASPSSLATASWNVTRSTADRTAWAGSGGTQRSLLSGRAQNWQNYRYKVFETIIPIRNLPWMGTCT